MACIFNLGVKLLSHHLYGLILLHVLVFVVLRNGMLLTLLALDGAGELGHFGLILLPHSQVADESILDHRGVWHIDLILVFFGIVILWILRCPYALELAIVEHVHITYTLSSDLVRRWLIGVYQLLDAASILTSPQRILNGHLIP